MTEDLYVIKNRKSYSGIGEKRKLKLKKSLPKYLKSKRKNLIQYFGEEKTKIIISEAQEAFSDIVNKMPYFKTPMYDSLIALSGKMAALKKGMKGAGIGTEEFIKFNIDETQITANKIPKFLRVLGGKIYLSRMMQKYLKRVAGNVSINGWPTKLITGSNKDDFAMSVETTDCQMINFWESIGEGDIKSYCAFFDFTSAEILGIGLKQVSSIESGLCKYCFYKDGDVEWPDPIKKILK